MTSLMHPLAAVDDVLRDIVDGDAYGPCDGVEILLLDGPWEYRLDRRSPRSRIDDRGGAEPEAPPGRERVGSAPRAM
jgi:hypothetical protein